MPYDTNGMPLEQRRSGWGYWDDSGDWVQSEPVTDTPPAPAPAASPVAPAASPANVWGIPQAPAPASTAIGNTLLGSAPPDQSQFQASDSGDGGYQVAFNEWLAAQNPVKNIQLSDYQDGPNGSAAQQWLQAKLQAANQNPSAFSNEPGVYLQNAATKLGISMDQAVRAFAAAASADPGTNNTQNWGFWGPEVIANMVGQQIGKSPVYTQAQVDAGQSRAQQSGIAASQEQHFRDEPGAWGDLATGMKNSLAFIGAVMGGASLVNMIGGAGALTATGLDAAAQAGATYLGESGLTVSQAVSIANAGLGIADGADPLQTLGKLAAGQIGGSLLGGAGSGFDGGDLAAWQAADQGMSLTGSTGWGLADSVANSTDAFGDSSTVSNTAPEAPAAPAPAPQAPIPPPTGSSDMGGPEDAFNQGTGTAPADYYTNPDSPGYLPPGNPLSDWSAKDWARAASLGLGGLGVAGLLPKVGGSTPAPGSTYKPNTPYNPGAASPFTPAPAQQLMQLPTSNQAANPWSFNTQAVKAGPTAEQSTLLGPGASTTAPQFQAYPGYAPGTGQTGMPPGTPAFNPLLQTGLVPGMAGTVGFNGSTLLG